LGKRIGHLAENPDIGAHNRARSIHHLAPVLPRRTQQEQAQVRVLLRLGKDDEPLSLPLHLSIKTGDILDVRLHPFIAEDNGKERADTSDTRSLFRWSRQTKPKPVRPWDAAIVLEQEGTVFVWKVDP